MAAVGRNEKKTQGKFSPVQGGKKYLDHGNFSDLGAVNRRVHLHFIFYLELEETACALN